MALTITATAGASDANSFVTEAEQIAYMATRLNASTWTTVTGSTCTENEKKAMISATRLLSSRTWQGRRTDTVQVLSWPRWGVHDPDSPSGFLIESTVIPQRVKDAACELAFQFLNLGTTDLFAVPERDGVIEETIDVLTTRWSDRHNQPVGLDRFPLVLDLVRPLLAGSSVSTTLVRG
jgi:hypothetical protein